MKKSEAKPLNTKVVILGGLILALPFLIIWICIEEMQTSRQGRNQEQNSESSALPGSTENTSAQIPPYFKSAEAAKPFPNLMPPERYQGYPAVQRAYRIAHEMPGVIAQQPCYCWCEGHRSLLDCYSSDHGAG